MESAISKIEWNQVTEYFKTGDFEEKWFVKAIKKHIHIALCIIFGF